MSKVNTKWMYILFLFLLFTVCNSSDNSISQYRCFNDLLAFYFHKIKNESVCKLIEWNIYLYIIETIILSEATLHYLKIKQQIFNIHNPKTIQNAVLTGVDSMLDTEIIGESVLSIERVIVSILDRDFLNFILASFFP